MTSSDPTYKMMGPVDGGGTGRGATESLHGEADDSAPGSTTFDAAPRTRPLDVHALDDAEFDSLLLSLLSSSPDAMDSIMDDPWPLFARLREESPVRTIGDITLVSRYDDVKALIKDTASFSNQFQKAGNPRAAAIARTIEPGQRWMAEEIWSAQRLFVNSQDGEDHRRRRNVLRHVFAPRRIAGLRERMVEDVERILDEMSAVPGPAEWDIMARSIPSLATCDLLDLSRSAAPRLLEWGSSIMDHLHGGERAETLPSAHAALVEALKFIEESIERNRASDEHGELVSALLAAADEEVISLRELSFTFLEQQLAFDTTHALLMNGLYELLRHRDQWDRLVAHPELVRSATAEVLRYVSPSLWFMRITTREVELAGVRIPPEQRVFYVMGAANHDPRRFGNPDVFDIGRENAKDALAFGFGVHYCIGHALASLEAEVVFGQLARRFPTVRRADPNAAVRWTGSGQLRRVHSLPLHLG